MEKVLPKPSLEAHFKLNPRRVDRWEVPSLGTPRSHFKLNPRRVDRWEVPSLTPPLSHHRRT